MSNQPAPPERIRELEKIVESQNRELGIEAALERVRAVAMGMKEPVDMLEICRIIASQLALLNVKEIRNVQTAIFYESNGTYMNYEYYAKHNKTIITETSYTDHNIPRAFADQMLKGKGEFFSTQISKTELPGWIEYQKTTNVFIDSYLENASSLNYYWYSLGPVALGTSAYVPLTQEELGLFKRFRNVFELAYRRFMDIELALTQAREAQIEAALERVRSATMAMHSSNDLHNVIRVLTDQLSVPGLHFHTANFVTNDSMPDWEIWISSPGVAGVPPRIHIPYVNHILFNQRNDAIAAGKEILTISLHKEEKDSFFHYLFEKTAVSVTPAERKEWVYQQKGMALTTVLMKNISLSVINYDGILYTPEENEVIKRFTNVFEQSYTRFLDLQKAEAQARESQIQLALERVRARTMAMQRSDELPEAANLLFQQVQSLGAPTWTAGYCIWHEDKKAVTLWVSGPFGDIQPPFRVPLDESPLFIHSLEAHNKGVELYVEEISGKALEELYRYLHSLPVASELLDAILKEGRPVPTYEVDHCAYFSKGFLLFVTYQQVPELHDTFKRLAAVFDQTYTRFLDLQKAEAQARESNIQLALERVRARTMAMQRSDELLGVVSMLYEQLNNLQFDSNACNIIIIDKESNNQRYWVSGFTQKLYPESYNVPYFKHPYIDDQMQAWKEGQNYIVIEYSGKMKQEFDKQFFSQTDFKNIPVEVQKVISALPSAKLSTAFFTYGALQIISSNPLSEENAAILQRFAKVFDQTYTRFLDLQKAEAQAREAEIELALERVRSKTMAMQQQHDLLDVTDLFAEQLIHLGFDLDVVNFSNGLSYGDWDIWITAPASEKTRATDRVVVPWIEHPYFQKARIGLDNFKKGIDLNIAVFSKEEKDSFLDHLLHSNSIFRNLPGESRAYLYNKPGFTLSTIFLKETWVSVCKYDTKPFSDEQHTILRRFANAFGQAYTRFLDLKKAEAQAREAQIEAALEKIRSRSLAMHKSDELQDVVHTVFEKLKELNVDFYTVIIIIFQENSKDIVWWLENREQQQYPRILLPYSDNPYLSDLFEARENDLELLSRCYSFEEKNQLFNYLFKDTDFRHVPQKQKKFLFESEFTTISVALAKNTGIHITSYSRKSFSEQEHEILKRFAKVFDQAYTRFLDLQKAEAQTREAQIEAALERVRGKTMAMHTSTELQNVIMEMASQLENLGFKIDSANIDVNLEIHKDPNMHLWISVSGKQPYPTKIIIPYFDHPIFTKSYERLDKGETFFVDTFSREEKDTFFDYVFKHTILKHIPEERKQYIYNGKGMARSVAIAKHTALAVYNYDLIPYSVEENSILVRFSYVFDQTYTRFLDLEKAEAQAREAQIEAALERVRAKVMSMRSSEDLNETIKVFYHQMESLSLTPARCGVGLLNKESRTAELSTINTTVDRQSIELIGKLDMATHPLLEGVYNGWLKQEEYHPVLRGNEIKEYYKILRPQIQFPDYPDDAVQYGYFFFFDEGGVYAWTEKQMDEAELQIYRRFTLVLNLTYKRYKDLKQAEANAKEAVKQAALDRIRADIASMRSVNDLDKITPLIWNELTILGIPFIRCGVFLMNNAQQLIHTFLSAPDGRPIAAFHMPYDTPGNLGNVLCHWQKKEKYTDQWSKNEFTSFADVLVKQGSIANKEEYLATLPDDGFYLHFLPFLQGMLYVGNITELNEEEIKLMQTVADAFSTAYARYEDFNKLEAAKKQVDSTLTELQATQKQLIQSEKMASLGELTAGIAHEIQNPLNFVNNFSDINTELIEEMKAELATGNLQLANDIAGDIRQNLEKISQHGKRADAIVKGMLQHSRTSTGQKEPTDINKLAEEYLHLAYHGMRAKDKSFNANFKFEPDDTIGKINIIPQDIGRVLLNLFNNAFYAVNEKFTANRLPLTADYKPTVSVRTKKVNDNVEIIVTDNGPGIPQNIVDKIFQPFFTTKPTGQGTGLGLSLAYDIIKVHGGEIQVDSKEGEGTEFVIMLPA